MNNLYTAVTKKDGNWWIGWVIEIPESASGVRLHKFTKYYLVNQTKK